MWHASSWLLRNALNLEVRVKCEKRAQQVPQSEVEMEVDFEVGVKCCMAYGQCGRGKTFTN